MEQNGWDVVWEEGSTSEWIVEYVLNTPRNVPAT